MRGRRLPSIKQLRSAAWSQVRWTSAAAIPEGNGGSGPSPLTVEMGSPVPMLIAMIEALLTSYRPGLIIHDTLSGRRCSRSPKTWV